MQEVARRLTVSHSGVQRLRDRFALTGSVAERRPAGRSGPTARQQDRLIVLTSLRNRTAATAALLRSDLRVAVNVSDQTICNRLHESNLGSTRPSSRPSLVQAHCAAFLAWSARHLPWTRQQWARLLFTDESPLTCPSTTREFESVDVKESASMAHA